MAEFIPHDLENVCTRIKAGGYVVASHLAHPHCWKRHGESTGELLYHRLVMENKLGRHLTQQEIVHHRDEDKQNNHPDNLELAADTAAHTAIHYEKPEAPLLTCLGCGTSFYPPWLERQKKYSVRKYCSTICRTTTSRRKKKKSAVADIRAAQDQYGEASPGLCLLCGEPIPTIGLKFCSHVCARKARRKTTRPTKEKLQQLVWNYPTTLIAKKLGVSDNTVSNWCKQYGIDKPPRGYWSTGRKKKNS